MMNEHPIEGLMNTVMSNLRDMIDVNTVIGESIELENGTVIVPVSKVGFGFAAGGSEFNSGTLEQHKRQGLDEETRYNLPFGGGSGAGVTVIYDHQLSKTWNIKLFKNLKYIQNNLILYENNEKL